MPASCRGSLNSREGSRFRDKFGNHARGLIEGILGRKPIRRAGRRAERMELGGVDFLTPSAGISIVSTS